MKRKNLLTALVVLLGLFLVIGPALAGNGPKDFCKKFCSCPDVREPRTDYCAKVRTNRGGMINPYRTTDDEGNPNRWIESISHNIPATVKVGQVVEASIDFMLLQQPEGSYPVIYNDIFADWAPDNRLAGISYVAHDPELISMPFTFTAPSCPGKYRIRWLHSSTYIPAHSFYCGYDGHWETGADPDYMSSAASWMEVPIEVVE